MIVVARRLAIFTLCFSTATACLALAFGQDNGECEPRWHSPAWWATHNNGPVGARQIDKYGREWPPYPRPRGPQQTCCQRYHAEHYWPWPYNCTDRQVVLEMSRTQEANGWLTETTLYDYHFNPETNELTVPGKLQLKWILEYVPANFRTVWLQQIEDPAVAQTRLNSVRQTALRLVGQAGLPQIAFRTATAPGRPAIEIDSIRRQEVESIPIPRIPFESSASGASSTNTGQNH